MGVKPALASEELLDSDVNRILDFVTRATQRAANGWEDHSPVNAIDGDLAQPHEAPLLSQ